MRRLLNGLFRLMCRLHLWTEMPAIEALPPIESGADYLRELGKRNDEQTVVQTAHAPHLCARCYRFIDGPAHLVVRPGGVMFYYHDFPCDLYRTAPQGTGFVWPEAQS
jgi:hypothetical protein